MYVMLFSIFFTSKTLLIKMRTIKQISIKYRTYYFYNNIIKLENFKSNLLKVDEKSYKDIGIYNIRYIKN